MKRYTNLIRLNKWRVDERRRHLAELETLAQEMRGRLDRMNAEIKAEQDLAHENKSIGHTFIAYAAAMNQRRETIENSIANVAEQIIRPTGLVDPEVEVHTYAQWEEEFKDKMEAAEIPLDRG